MGAKMKESLSSFLWEFHFRFFISNEEQVQCKDLGEVLDWTRKKRSKASNNFECEFCDKNCKISKEKLVHGAILRSSGLLKHERESPGTHFHSAKSNGEPSRPLWQNFISTRFRRFRVRKWIFQKKIVLEKFYKSKKVNRLKSRGMRCV